MNINKALRKVRVDVGKRSVHWEYVFKCIDCPKRILVRKSKAVAHTGRCTVCRARYTATLPSTRCYKDGRTFTTEYESYNQARQRCTNPKNKSWKNYGGRGIKFLFTSFEQFYAKLGSRPTGKSVDRINNNGHYAPGNVKWSTPAEQRHNQRPDKRVRDSNGRYTF